MSTTMTTGPTAFCNDDDDDGDHGDNDDATPTHDDDNDRSPRVFWFILLQLRTAYGHLLAVWPIRVRDSHCTDLKVCCFCDRHITHTCTGQTDQITALTCAAAHSQKHMHAQPVRWFVWCELACVRACFCSCFGVALPLPCSLFINQKRSLTRLGASERTRVPRTSSAPRSRNMWRREIAPKLRTHMLVGSIRSNAQDVPPSRVC